MKVQRLYNPIQHVREQLHARSVQMSGASLLSAMMLVIFAPQGMARDLDWGSLNLSPQQENQINRLENSWEKTHDEVSTQIERDTAELRKILPTGDTARIRMLQNRITTNKMYLLNESMETFLQKRDALTPGQRQQLQKMMPAKAH